VAEPARNEGVEPATVVQALLNNFREKLQGEGGNAIVPTVPELIRLFQFQHEIEDNTAPSVIEVRWIDWDGADSKL
jgi:hypothetical protein